MKSNAAKVYVTKKTVNQKYDPTVITTYVSGTAILTMWECVELKLADAPNVIGQDHEHEKRLIALFEKIAGCTMEEIDEYDNIQRAIEYDDPMGCLADYE